MIATAYHCRRAKMDSRLRGRRVPCFGQPIRYVRALEAPIKSDLARIDRMKDEDIDYSDIPPLDETFLTKPTMKWPPPKTRKSS